MNLMKEAEDKIVRALGLAGYTKDDVVKPEGCLFANAKPFHEGATHADLLIMKKGEPRVGKAKWVRLRHGESEEVWAKQIRENFIN
jgi:hypothetical protein